ncbi:hypothetical protein NC651_032595 [Populus alba x Populus x berolinensis]|nr:hypothetical protein NC651_032595 [Populus alba x Populus x berolinensis]
MMMMSQGGEYLRLFVPLSKSVLEKLLITIAVRGRMDEGLRLRKLKVLNTYKSEGTSKEQQIQKGFLASKVRNPKNQSSARRRIDGFPPPGSKT